MYPESYTQSRARFRAHLPGVRSRWRSARLESYSLEDYPDLTIDWIGAEAPQPRRLFMLTTGVHGIEGYVGSAMLELFITEFLPRLDPLDTSLVLLHAVNPWGMHHRRRFNPHNVDLNRNFIPQWGGLDSINPEYDRLLAFLCPQRPLKGWLSEYIAFFGGVVQSILKLGIAGSREAVLRGQYRHPRGIYFGGSQVQAETQLLMGLQQAALEKYAQIIHLDMHSGYGPRYQMSIVNAVSEPTSSEDCVRNFNCPRVVKTTPEEFYTINGDMTEYWYEICKMAFPAKQVYAAAFEFGAFGEGLPAAIRSLRATIFENQLFWHGASHPACAEAVRREYAELFFPSEPAWRAKAIQDARQAFEGILKYYSFVV